MRIKRLSVIEVVVPAHHGAVNSPDLDRPLHKVAYAGHEAWSIQFDEVPKAMLVGELDDGTPVLGECHRGHDREALRLALGWLGDRDVRTLPRQKIPVPAGRELAGVECLIWDAAAKAHGIAVVDLLGGPVRERVAVNAWSGHRTLEDLERVARNFRESGFDSLKLKCDLEDDVVGWAETVARSAPGLGIVLDPNGRWERLGEARRRVTQLGVVGNVRYVEDPLPHWMLDEMAELRRHSTIDLAAHVALPYPQDGERIENAVLAMRAGAVNAFNFTAGPHEFQVLSHLSEAAGIPCWLGSELDLGVLEALYLHQAAASLACTLPSDIFGRLIRSHDLLVDPIRIEPPFAYPPAGPGIGVDLDEAAMAEFAVYREDISF